MVPGKPVWDTVDFAKDVPKSTLDRYVLDPRAGGKLVSKARLSERYLDFPIVNRRVSCAEHRYVWASTGCSADGVAPIQGIIKVDTTDPTAEQVSAVSPCG